MAEFMAGFGDSVQAVVLWADDSWGYVDWYDQDEFEGMTDGGTGDYQVVYVDAGSLEAAAAEDCFDVEQLTAADVLRLAI